MRSGLSFGSFANAATDLEPARTAGRPMSDIGSLTLDSAAS
jgi:hypothetical protein